jgi:hydrogenase maturation protease
MTPDWNRNPEADRRLVRCLHLGQREVGPGDRVRLRPSARADIFDLALAGKLATIQSIEQDFEGRLYLAVTVDDDPGSDLGAQRQPGHRFFFGPDEVEPAEPAEAGKSSSVPRILIAGVGNVFLGDDAFGVEVARRLMDRPPRDEVRIVDFGIRGMDLAYALLDGYETVILLDAARRGGQPGTLYLVEPELGSADRTPAEPAMVDPHHLDPVRVLRLAQTLGERLPRVLLVACEPQPGEEAYAPGGLSPPVRAAVNEAVRLVESAVRKLLDPGSRLAASAGAVAGRLSPTEGENDVEADDAPAHVPFVSH